MDKVTRQPMENKIKNTLSETLGVVGFILWYAIIVCVVFAPFIFTGIPFWIGLIVIIAYFLLPFIGNILILAGWVWSVFLIVDQPFGILTILYLIVAILYITTSLIPWIIESLRMVWVKNDIRKIMKENAAAAKRTKRPLTVEELREKYIQELMFEKKMSREEAEKLVDEFY